MYKSLLLFLASFIVFTNNTTAQCVNNIDFNTWSQAGDPANGNWTVQNAGASVHQSINGQPTYYISPYDLINVEITGTFRTDHAADDDFMGFVIGYNNPIGNTTDHDYILFDWKQKQQTVSGYVAPEGMTLSRIAGNIPVSSIVYTEYFWGHSNSFPPVEVLGTNYGAGKGWVLSTDHQFRCIYTPNRITIYIDGNLVFDVLDCFKPGKFGFYNYSQPDVTYSNFNYTLATDFQVELNNICQNDSASFLFIDICSANFNYNVIDEMTWDFGDGQTYTNSNPTGQNINPKHMYANGGTYTVRLTTTDQNGCQDVATQSISVYAVPDAQISVPDVCFNETSEFENLSSAGDGNITQWDWDRGDGVSSNAFDFNYQYPDSGVYAVQLIVSDDNGCTDTASVQHTVNPLPQLSTQVFDLSCFEAADGEVHPKIMGGNPAYSFAWSNGSSDSIINNLSTGTYTLTVTDLNSCEDVFSNTVNQPDLLEIEVQLSDFNSYQISCYKFTDGSIDILAKGGTSPYQYDWNSGQFSTANIQNLGAGTYQLSLRDMHNCPLDSTIVLNAPDSLYASASLSVYNGGWGVSCAESSDGNIDLSVFGGVAGYTYSWNNGAFSSQDLSNLAKGIYTLELRDLNNCLFRDSFLIEAPDSISSTVKTSAYNGAWGVSCFGENDGYISAAITGGVANYTYNWSNLGNSDSIYNLSASSYNLTVTDANGCTHIIDSIEITEPKELSASISSEDNTCYQSNDGRIEVYAGGGTPNYTYTWTDSVLDESSRSALEIGTYQVSVSDQNNCQVILEATIYQPDSLGLSLADSIEIIYGGIAELEAQYQENGRANYFAWSPEENLTCFNCPDPDANPLGRVVYTLELYDNYGCSIKDSILVIAEEKVLYAPNAFSPNGDGINDNFTIYSAGVKSFKLRIFNRWGELICLTEDIEKGWDGNHANGAAMHRDVYVYTAQLIYFDGEVEKIEGSVTLLR